MCRPFCMHVLQGKHSSLAEHPAYPPHPSSSCFFHFLLCSTLLLVLVSLSSSSSPSVFLFILLRFLTVQLRFLLSSPFFLPPTPFPPPPPPYHIPSAFLLLPPLPLLSSSSSPPPPYPLPSVFLLLLPLPSVLNFLPSLSSSASPSSFSPSSLCIPAEASFAANADCVAS